MRDTNLVHRILILIVCIFISSWLILGFGDVLCTWQKLGSSRVFVEPARRFGKSVALPDQRLIH